MKRAKRILRDFAASVRRAAGRIVRFGAVMAGVAAGALVLFTRQSFKSLDILAKMSSRLGIAADELRALGRAAELSGAGLEDIDKAIGLMAKNVGDAADGLGEARLAIEELGLDAQKLIKMKPDEAFLAFADAISKVSTQMKRLQLSRLIFGRGGSKLLNLLQQGKDAIRGMVDESKRLSGEFDDFELVKIEAANDAFGDLGRAARSAFDTLATEFAPFVETFSKSLTDGIVEFRKVFLTNLRMVGLGFAGVVGEVNRLINAIATLLKPSNVLALGKAGIVGFQELLGGTRGVKGAVGASAASLIQSGFGPAEVLPTDVSKMFLEWWNEVVGSANQEAKEAIKQVQVKEAKDTLHDWWASIRETGAAVARKFHGAGPMGTIGTVAAAVRQRPTLGSAFQPSLFTPQSITSQKAQPVHDSLVKEAINTQTDDLVRAFFSTPTQNLRAN